MLWCYRQVVVMSDGACVAVVARWSKDEGWGVLEAEELPGGCWVHFSVIDAEGWRGLTTGSLVAVWWSRFRQDGYPFRANRVLPAAGVGCGAPIADADMIAALQGLRTADVEVVRVDPLGDGAVLLQFRAVGGNKVWKVELPLPSSSRLKPWLYCTPDDAEDAASMLAIFLDEEVATTAVESARRDGSGRLVLASYGFERQDQLEHERLQRGAGEDGWHGRQTEGGPLNFTNQPDAPRGT